MPRSDNTPAIDREHTLEEMEEALRILEAMYRDNNDVPKDLLTSILKAFNNAIGAIHYNEDLTFLSSVRKRFIAAMTPLLDRNYRLPMNRRINIPYMSTVNLPSRISFTRAPEALPTGLDLLFDIDPNRNSASDLYKYVKRMEKELAHDSAVLQSTSEYKEFFSTMKLFLQEISEQAGSDDAYARRRFTELRDLYRKVKTGIYNLKTPKSTPATQSSGSKAGATQLQIPSWKEPSRPIDELDQGPSQRQLKHAKKSNPLNRLPLTPTERKSQQAETERQRDRLTRNIHWSTRYMKPSGEERVLGDPPNTGTGQFSSHSSGQASPEREYLGDLRKGTFHSPGHGPPAGRGGRDVDEDEMDMDGEEGVGKGKGKDKGKGRGKKG